VELLKRRELTGDALDQISQTGGLRVVIGDRKDVDLHGHRGLGWEVLLPIGAQNRLGPTTITAGAPMI